MRTHFPKRHHRTKAQVHLVRYCDDFIITGCSQAVLAQEVQPLVERFLAERGLHLSPEKTRITHIAEGFDFLGQHIRKYKDKLLIKPSRQSVHALLEKVRQVLSTNKATAAVHVIGQLNPLLRGWANYHRHVVSKATFNTMDQAR